eukprot:TRINITY_DN2595_c0_g1_i1.p1 TRINITY_DN2595_c0_g1~~TRINITY_DN2595_c0_g1_i1.p1  ORF type:complete len:223 (+),score=104.91 TRINITY_DN2595_c0_g1_i1:199-867(+)
MTEEKNDAVPGAAVEAEKAKEELPKPEAPKDVPKAEDEEGKKEDSDDEDAPELVKQDGGKEGGKADHKANKGEKKCRKALIKLGMKPVTGITRVTLKKSGDVIFAISNPEVLKSATSDNCYVVFGQMAYEDPNSPGILNAASEFTKPEESKAEEKKEEAKTEAAEVKKEPEEDEGEPESEEGLTASNIEVVMSHTKCSRNKAIRALRETNDDMVNAILKLTT